ncbi:MAG TPA: outer membrane lipoprotein carrier protein LolA [Gemmatimonadales bacterium]|nr:outer membrane lipoprotein carrier protein LolA [Gemmatimonadales bacterium]
MTRRRVARCRRALPLAVGAALAVMPAGGLIAQNPSAATILDGAAAAFRRATTLRADFTQYLRDPMIGSSDTSSGEFLRESSGRFAFRWRHPAGDVILADGSVLWAYLPSSAPGQVVRSTLTGKPGESADVLAEFLDDPAQRFLVSYVRADSVGTRPADELSLVPRQQGTLPYRRVLIWVDRADSLVRRVEINEGSGAVRRILLDRLRVNVPIPASTFVFRPPKGVRVVDASH